MRFLYFLIIGILAGALAGRVVQGSGFGMLRNLVVGVVGALVGGFLFELLGLHAVGLLGKLIAATFGAVVCLLALRYLASGGG